MDKRWLNFKVEEETQKISGVDLGFSDLSALPKEMTLGYSRGITLFVPLAKGILSEMSSRPTITYFAHYRAVNRLIDALSLRISLKLESLGYTAFAIPASQSLPEHCGSFKSKFSHKTAAVLSGKGFIGKSALFIHRRFGPAVRMGTVLTDAPIEAPTIAERDLPVSHCGECRECANHCPALAIEGRNWEYGMPREMLYDARACSDHMKNAYQDIGRGSVCGLCIVHCPFYKRNLKNVAFLGEKA